jgi:multidrug resistance efflux pump
MEPEMETMGSMEGEKKSSGAMVGLVVIIIILVVGVLYVWKASKDTSDVIPVEDTPVADIAPEVSADIENLDADLSDLDADLNLDDLNLDEVN